MSAPLTFGILCIGFGILIASMDAWTAIISFFIGAWCIHCACKEKTGGNKSNSNSTHHKMSDDDKWLEENSWVWSDPNYNGKRNRKK